MPGPLDELRTQGQSIWYDDLNRELIRSGALRRLVDEDHVTGGTSNPTIFQKALQGSDAYQDQLTALIRDQADAQAIYDALTITDVRLSADSFQPVYEREAGADGYASLEVSPKLAYDTQASIEAAQHLFQELGRPNAMIKIPGTEAGLPAIHACLRAGVNINITLLFSVQRYEKVAWAYVSALEERVAANEPIDRLASVASFFVSRVDTLIDEKIDSRVREYPFLADLKGKAAIANARLAYAKFREIFSSSRWQALAERGARVQRCLWASTSVKNPAYRDVRYVEELIGRETITTMPGTTLEAFKDHGRVNRTLDQDVEQAGQVVQALDEGGIHIEAAAATLEEQGVNLFSESFDEAMTLIRAAISTRA